VEVAKVSEGLVGGFRIDTQSGLEMGIRFAALWQRLGRILRRILLVEEMLWEAKT